MEKKLDEINNQEIVENNSHMKRIEQLLKENLEMNQEMRSMIRHINTYVAWQRIFGWLKLLLILIPLVIGVIYLPPLFQNFYQQFIAMMSGGVCQ
jgi:hypothetical protein